MVLEDDMISRIKELKDELNNNKDSYSQNEKDRMQDELDILETYYVED